MCLQACIFVLPSEYNDGGRSPQGRKKSWSSFPGSSGKRNPHYEYDGCEPQPSHLQEDYVKVVMRDVQMDPKARE